MARGCVFNECCLDDLAGVNEHVAVPLLHKLGALIRVLGPIRVAPEVLTKTVGLGDSLSEWLRRGLESAGQDREEARSLAFALVSISAPAISDGTWDSWLAPENNTPVVGLAVAHRDGVLAVSLDTAVRWDSAYIAITLSWLGEDSDGINTEICSVHHAVRDAHIGEHKSRLDTLADAAGQLRLRLHIQRARTVHKSATAYKKHVKGGSNAERQHIASTRLEGQFLKQLGSATITDDDITNWERNILDRVAAGQADVKVIRHSPDTYYAFGEMPHDVGFLGDPGGPLTKSMRVEWSSGEVHSHPRKPDPD